MFDFVRINYFQNKVNRIWLNKRLTISRGPRDSGPLSEDLEIFVNVS